MIQLICKETLYAYDTYHLLRAFYPGKVVEQKIDRGQEPLISVVTEGGSCFCCGQEQDHLSKREVILQFYHMLSEKTGRQLPWGILTGVRPTKLMMSRLKQGDSSELMGRWMSENYLVSEEKAALAARIVQREKQVSDQLEPGKGYSLYVGIPFCPSICAYCSFSSSPIEKWKDRTEDYLDALCKEIRFVAESAKQHNLQSESGKEAVLDTIYIGGGTPTTLSAEQLERLLSHLESNFDCAGLKEFTVEAGRPDSITEEKLQVLRRHPVSRISINPQTMQQKTLDRIGRRHSVEDVRKAFFMAREAGFDNINMDLIAGLPGEGLADMEDTLAQLERFAPDSLTVHALAVKRAAYYGQNPLELTPADQMDKMISCAQQSAERMGLLPYYLYRQKNMAGNYENVGYAKVDKAGIYNILIMEEIQTIVACGAGASTKIVLPEPVLKDGKKTNLIRIENVKNVQEYIDRIDEMIERKEKWLWH
jgi:coproporphyrinogen dehydrogenase HemZ